MSMIQGMRGNASPVDDLNSILTRGQVQEFTKKAIVELKLGQASLELSLAGQQSEAAAKQAHKLKSTMSLFSANSLVKSLDLIESGVDPAIYLPEFRESLMIQCEELVDGLERYLANS